MFYFHKVEYVQYLGEVDIFHTWVKKISSSLQQCKNYKNWSRFFKVMRNNVLPPFLGMVDSVLWENTEWVKCVLFVCSSLCAVCVLFVCCLCAVCAAVLLCGGRAFGIWWLSVSCVGWRYWLAAGCCRHSCDPSLGSCYYLSVNRFMPGIVLAHTRSCECGGSKPAWCGASELWLGSCTGV